MVVFTPPVGTSPPFLLKKPIFTYTLNHLLIHLINPSGKCHIFHCDRRSHSPKMYGLEPMSPDIKNLDQNFLEIWQIYAMVCGGSTQPGKKPPSFWFSLLPNQEVDGELN